MSSNHTTSTATTPRRKGIIARNVASASSSIWESRIKMDEVKGGVKVLNANEGKDDEEGVRVLRKLRRNQSESVAEGKKRKSWKSTETNPIQLRKSRSEITNSRTIQVEDSKKEVLLIENGNEIEAHEMEVEKQMDCEMEKEKEKEKEKGVNENHESPMIEDCIVEEIDPKEIDAENAEINDEVQPVQANEMQEINSDNKFEKEETNTETTNSSPEEKKHDPVMDNRAINPEPVKLSPKKSTLEKKASSVINHRRSFKSEPKKPIHVEVQFEDAKHTTNRNHDRLQNIVDLVMWRDASKSAFVFGLGTFMLVSSSYTKDLNFSLISATSYMGLTYLGLIFAYKTILQRGANSENSQDNEECILVGEEDAIWLLRFLLPYLNELLLKLRALFSGDPATTMKLALLLFAMARCGNFVTLWTLAKLVFFGVFTIPKICSSYSTHLARHGKFWVERFRDTWESCTHKKAVAAALFTIIWNISSTTARVWAVFMLVVAIKYYQQKMAAEWVEQEDEKQEEQEELNYTKTKQNVGNGLQNRQRRGPVSFELEKGRRVKRVA